MKPPILHLRKTGPHEYDSGAGSPSERERPSTLILTPDYPTHCPTHCSHARIFLPGPVCHESYTGARCPPTQPEGWRSLKKKVYVF